MILLLFEHFLCAVYILLGFYALYQNQQDNWPTSILQLAAITQLVFQYSNCPSLQDLLAAESLSQIGLITLFACRCS